MTKQEALVNISTIFNRGSSIDKETEYFNQMKHDKLLDLLLQHVQDSSTLIGNPRIFKTQALNDHGVDLIVEYPNNAKIGIQIKSHFDVSEKDFAIKVKAQMAESQFHGLDKWYLMICSPLLDGKNDYVSKISHLINELSSYKTSYHVVYSPQQCFNILTKTIMLSPEFHLIKNQFFFEPTDWTYIINEIKSNKDISSYLSKVEIQKDNKANTAEKYLNYLGLGKAEKAETIEDLDDLQILLKKLTRKTREFLYAVLVRSVKKDRLRQLILTPCQDLENYLNISSEKIKKEVAILENYGIAEIDDDFGSGIYYVAIRRTNPNYNILEDIRDFCKKINKPLNAIIIDLDFSHFDN